MKEERTMTSNSTRYSVGGVLLPRPFKIRRLGHFGFNAVQMTEGLDFYERLLGFRHSDVLDFGKMPWAPKGGGLGDTRGYFMRYGTDHHAFVLFNKRVLDHRPDRKFAPEVTVNQITWQCGSLKEIMDAHAYFQEHGIPIQRVGRDMPGSNWYWSIKPSFSSALSTVALPSNCSEFPAAIKNLSILGNMSTRGSTGR